MAPLNPLAMGLPIMILVVFLEFLSLPLGQILSPLAVTLIIRLLQIAVMATGIFHFNKKEAPFSLAIQPLRRALLKGVIWSGAFGFLAAALGLLLFAIGINPLKLFGSLNHQSAFQRAFFFFTGAFVSPVAEELLFRGILYASLRPMGMLPALAITTLLFAGAHGLSGAVPITQIIGGLLFGLAYEKERHILVPILIHVLGNSALFTLAAI